MYRYEDIRAVHLEITARCNASCPMCPRNLEGGRVSPNLPLTELALADVRAIFPEPFVRQLSQIYMCGNYGDAMVARDTVESFEYLRSANQKISLRMHTNGSGREAAWWRRLAKTATTCVFGIDGLEDTNHLYRRGTSWKRIMAAAEAFLAAGGKAEWEFIVFRHNEGQVEAARELSLRMGFKKFTAKRTERFLVAGRKALSRPVRDRFGKVEYSLEMPSGAEHRNEALESLDQLPKSNTHYDAYLRETEVECKAVKDRKIYVSAEGLAFPCCWTGKLYSPYQRAGEGEIWEPLRKLPGGKAFLDARRRPLKEIVESAYFQELVPAAWRAGSPERKGFLVCARACGKLDIMRAQRPPAQGKPA